MKENVSMDNISEKLKAENRALNEHYEAMFRKLQSVEQELAQTKQALTETMAERDALQKELQAVKQDNSRLNAAYEAMFRDLSLRRGK